MEEQKTNFDRCLERKLRDPDFRARFEAADQAWDIALQLAALLSELRAADNLLAEDWKAGDGLTIFLRSVHPPAATPGFQAPIAGWRGAPLHDGKLPAGAVMGRRTPAWAATRPAEDVQNPRGPLTFQTAQTAQTARGERR